MWSYYCVVLTLFVFGGAQQSAIPSYLKICHQSDKNLEECIKKSIEVIRPKLAAGIPELFIPAAEPFQVPEFKLERSSGPISIKSTFKDILVSGLSQFATRSVRIDLEKNKFRLKLWFPEMHFSGKYSITGKIMLMPLRGQGGFTGNFTDIDATVFLVTDRVNKNGRVHLQIQEVAAKFNVGDSKIKLENLFNGDKELGAAVNKFLNENWKSVAAEVRPAIEKTISEMLYTISTKLFDEFTFDQLLPE